jgi:hypothetical protein
VIVNSPTLALTLNEQSILDMKLPDFSVVAATTPGPALDAVPEPHVDTGLLSYAKAAIEKGFHIFPLIERGKKPPKGSHGFQDSKAPSDPQVLEPWRQNPNLNIGIDLGASGRTVLDFDKLESIPDWINAIRTFKVGTSRGVHVHFSGSHSSTGLFIDGVKVGDLQSIGTYVLAAGSIHPSGLVYTVIDDSPIIPLPDVSTLVKHESERVNASIDGPPIPRGSHDRELFRSACLLRNAGMGYDEIKDQLIQICEKRCVDHGTDYVDMCEKKAAQAVKYPVGTASPKVVFGGGTGQRAKDQAEPIQDDDDIPEFDESVITGIYRDIVTLAVRGTTIPPQFALLNAKVYFGALLAGKTTFEGLDSDSSYYGTAIGETGTSKGESWRRTFEAILHPEFLNLNQSLKVIYSADSGAGLKDCFFEPPREVPVVCYVDEVTTLGHKGGEKKNPEIIDTIVELADSHQVSRVLAKKGKLGGSKTHDNARLSLYICGQDGPAFMSAFAGRTKIGLFDRFYPEFSGPIEAGDLPEINQSDVLSLHAKITALNFNCKKMTMSDSTRLDLGIFWSAQPVEIRRKIRFRKYLILDMYMAAFGRGVTVAEPEDLAVAIKMFTRQIVIRKVHFTGEVPDRVGFYLGHLKKWMEWMQKRLIKGTPIEEVAMSKRDFQTLSHAFRDNETHIFDQAWRGFHMDWLRKVSIIAANGQQYDKFVPVPREDETWLSLT